MTSILHLVDRTCGWEQQVGLSQLLDRLPRDRFAQTVATIGPVNMVDALGPVAGAVERWPAWCQWSALAPLAVRAALRRAGVDVVHAWSPRAALSARASFDGPIVLSMFDPCEVPGAARAIRTLCNGPSFGVVCSAERVRRRLAEEGIPYGACALVRPGVDFGVVNRVRRGNLRSQLNVDPKARLVTVNLPPRREWGAWDAFWICALMDAAGDPHRVVMPLGGRDADVVCRQASRIPASQTFVAAPPGVPTEQLVSACDLIIMPSAADQSTSAVAWAMAAGVAVIGAAGYAITELIASRVNGLLFKRRAERSPLPELARLIRDREGQRTAIEVARGHAYEVFGLRRSIEQHARVYTNLIHAVPLGEGVIDPALLSG